MPYARETNEDLPKCVETGQTALTTLLNGRGSDLEAVEEHSHWGAFKEPGHLQQLDAGCVELLGLNGELVEHLRHHWPPKGTALVHLAIVNAVLDRMSIQFSWKLVRRPETSVSASDTGDGVLNVTIFSPVATARRGVRKPAEVASPVLVGSR